MKRLLIILLRGFHYKALLFFLLSLGFLAMPRTAAAQQDLVDDQIVDVSDLCDLEFDCELESVAIIFDSTSPTQLDVLSETDVNLDALEDGWAAYDCGSIFEDDSGLDSGCADDDGSGVASLSGSFPIDAENVTFLYTLFTDSFLADVLNDDFACDDGDPEFCFEIVSTGVDVVIGPIHINTVSPSLITVGTSGTLTITGENLVDPFGGQPDVQTRLSSGTGSGFTVSSPDFSPDGSQGTVSYQAAQNTTVGNWDIGISYLMGFTIILSVDSQKLTVGYPPASVTKVDPQPWQAGQSNFTVTITGQNFGPNPTLAITGTGVSLINFTPNANGQSIVATVSVDPNAPNGTALVDVGPGYNGPFVCACTGSGHGTYSVAVRPVIAPPPQILYFGNIVPGLQSVTVGQQIALTAQIPTTIDIASYSWSLTGPGSVIKSFMGDATSERPTALTAMDFTQPGLTFYWVSTGGLTEALNPVTFSYCLVNQQCSTPVTANFDVSGPNGSAQPKISTTAVNVFRPPGDTRDFLAYQAVSPSVPGITFQAPDATNLPAGNNGSYQWVQLIDQDKVLLVNHSGVGSCNFLVGNDPELDTAYPYGATKPRTVITTKVPNDTANDSPNVIVAESIGEVQRAFIATMYLEWIPTKDGVCTSGGACTIPVPLGSATWKWSGCAINAQKTTDGSNGSNLIKSCSSDPQALQMVTFQHIVPSSGNNFGYVGWSNTWTGLGCP